MISAVRDSFGVDVGRFEVVGDESYRSRFAVTDLAVELFGVLGCVVADLVCSMGLADHAANFRVNRRRALLWYDVSIRPHGWVLPPLWDELAGDYETRDGWVRLHTNLAHHRAAALKALQCGPTRGDVTAALKAARADEVETAVVEAGGVAAAMRSMADWARHPQGEAVASEPLVHWTRLRSGVAKTWGGTKERPLAGLKVLDLTRVLAGPVATRVLAGFGADVLRIDPPNWDEPNVVPDVTLGKRCARLDLRLPEDREKFEVLLASADILVHGYRPGALSGLGYGREQRAALSPGLIEVCLDAYGWTGLWATRRGFDSLVQMSCGIADAGRAWAGGDKPVPLPVQALDHATGYLMAIAVMRLLRDAAGGQSGGMARFSLARTAELLKALPVDGQIGSAPEPCDEDFAKVPEQTVWGPCGRLRPALEISGTPMAWARPACALGSHPPRWSD